MDIIIRKCEVYQEVEKITSIIGSQTDRFKEVWASPHDAPTLDVFWRDAVSSVYDLFRRYLLSGSVEYNLHESDRDEIFVLQAEMPIGFEERLGKDILNNIKALFVSTIVSGWFGLKLPERAEEYANDAVSYGASIKEKLLFRKDPEQMRAYNRDEDDVRIIRRNYEDKNCASQRGDCERRGKHCSCCRP